MAKVILICGKICSGKSHYAKQLQQQHNAVILSTDDYRFGGMGRIYHQTYTAEKVGDKLGIRLYLPSRTAVILTKK